VTSPLGAARPSSRPRRERTPLYARLLRLRHLELRGWQRVLLGEGAVVLGVLVAMADLASAWSVAVLPLAVAAGVKFHDVLAGLLASPGAPGSGSTPERVAR
jgi:hypothetical protein